MRYVTCLIYNLRRKRSKREERGKNKINSLLLLTIGIPMYTCKCAYFMHIDLSYIITCTSIHMLYIEMSSLPVASEWSVEGSVLSSYFELDAMFVINKKSR
jgi:hypothetical protein